MKNPNFKSNDDGDEEEEDDDDVDDDDDDETLRRGCCVKRLTRNVTRVHLGGMELDIQRRAEISGSEKRAPHDVHGCSSLSPLK